MNYLTIRDRVANEIVITKSRFITTIIPVQDEEDALIKLAEIRRNYSDATHNVYAYISNKDGTGIRFSDDGEPSGTSAAPMLDVLKKRRIVCVLAVVTRYFGGVKLGAGGLVGAYSKSVSECLDKAQIQCYELSDIVSIMVEYNMNKTMEQLLRSSDIKLIDTKYENNITYFIAIKSQEKDNFIEKVTDKCLGQVKINIIDKKYIDFN